MSGISSPTNTGLPPRGRQNPVRNLTEVSRVSFGPTPSGSLPPFATAGELPPKGRQYPRDLLSYIQGINAQLSGTGAFFPGPDIGNPLPAKWSSALLQGLNANPTLYQPLPPPPPPFKAVDALPPKGREYSQALRSFYQPVNITGAAFTTVPNVMGPIQQADAIALTLAANLVPITPISWVGLANCTQSIPPGTQEAIGTQLTILPVGLIVMPFLIGMDPVAAALEVTNLGLGVRVIQVGYPSAQDVIINQGPPANTQVPFGYMTTLYRGLPYYIGTGNRHTDDTTGMVNVVIGPNSLFN